MGIQDGQIIDSPSSTILGPNDTDSITDAFCDAKKDLFGDVKDYQEHGGMKGMGESLDRGHVMIFSLWDDVEVNMLWLDSAFPLDKPETDPGVKRGDCPGGVESTPTYLRENFPNGYVTFKNAAVGEIGSTTSVTQAPSPVTTPYPTQTAPTSYPTHKAPTPYPTHKAPTPYPTQKAPTSYPTQQSCSAKSQPCEKNSDCCKKKCNKTKKKCKK